MSRATGDIFRTITATFNPRPSRPDQRALRFQHQQFGKSVGTGTLEPSVVLLVKNWLNSIVVICTLMISALVTLQPPSAFFLGFALATLLIGKLLFSQTAIDHTAIGSFSSRLMASLRPVGEFACAVAILQVLATTLKLATEFSPGFVATWLVMTPMALLFANASSSRLARWLVHSRPIASRHIIIGMNDIGVELAKRMKDSPHLGNFAGYFDYRSADRLPSETSDELVGHCKDVADYIKRNAIGVVYISLPLSATPRIEYLLKELRDTTASIYFVPNMFAFDLVQAKCASVNGIPVLSICDTPFKGVSGLRKRIEDVVVASLALAMLWPVMLVVAIAVRVTSPGPVLFKQKRYGLNGEEILVYKFRSMTVCDNGPVVVQATKNDARITPLGAFLRKSSLDELPQILNVLEGKMSFVGPRPHAVAHNEMYRKLISGYMLRHKVRPGITGWAQVNGLRGETSTIDKMEQRVQFDLDYLRNWSIQLDLKIIVKTALMILRDRNAY